MKALCIVPCGRTKIWDKEPAAGPSPARLAYIGPFSEKCRSYAEFFYPSSWCVLSAKYGFVWPDEIIPGPYDVSFGDPRTHTINVGHLMSQAEEKGLYTYESIVILGGRRYARVAEDVFREKRIVRPLADCKGIGFMMALMKKALMTGVRL
jgi:hypothetical protein